MAGRASNAVLFCCRYSGSLVQKAPWQQSKRSFNSTRSFQKYGPVPVFRTSDSAPQELKDLLENIRNTIVIPGRLNIAHKNLIFKSRNHSMLISDPVIVQLGDEDHTLQPLLHTRDIPPSWKSLLQATQLMGDSVEDWRGSFLGLLEGFKGAGKRWKDWQWEIVIRRAVDRGLVGLVIEAARRGERTGLQLKSVRLVRQVFWGCRVLAMDGRAGSAKSWEEETTLEALRYAEQVAQLLELDTHCGGAGFAVDGSDPRVQPDCMGVCLELAALRAQNHLGGKDEDGKVKVYAERLITNLKKGVGEGMDEYEESNMSHGRVSAAADYELMRWIPVMNGLEVARKVLGTELSEDEFVQTKVEQLRLKMHMLKGQVLAIGMPVDLERRRGLKWLQDLEPS